MSEEIIMSNLPKGIKKVIINIGVLEWPAKSLIKEASKYIRGEILLEPYLLGYTYYL